MDIKKIIVVLISIAACDNPITKEIAPPMRGYCVVNKYVGDVRWAMVCDFEGARWSCRYDPAVAAYTCDREEQTTFYPYKPHIAAK